MAIPLRLLWNLQISLAKKISAMAVMGVGIVTMVCAIIRTSSLSGFAKAGPIPVSWIALWAAIEGLIGMLSVKKLYARRALLYHVDGY